jgi:hypothetical protein
MSRTINCLPASSVTALDRPHEGLGRHLTEVQPLWTELVDDRTPAASGDHQNAAARQRRQQPCRLVEVVRILCAYDEDVDVEVFDVRFLFGEVEGDDLEIRFISQRVRDDFSEPRSHVDQCHASLVDQCCTRERVCAERQARWNGPQDAIWIGKAVGVEDRLGVYSPGCTCRRARPRYVSALSAERARNRINPGSRSGGATV